MNDDAGNLGKLKERLNRGIDKGVESLVDGNFDPVLEPVERAAREAGKWAWAGWLVFLFSRKPGLDRSNALGVIGSGIAVVGLLIPQLWFTNSFAAGLIGSAMGRATLAFNETTYYFSFAPTPWAFLFTPEVVGLVLAVTRFRLLLWGPGLHLLLGVVSGGFALSYWLEASKLTDDGGMIWLSWILRGGGACLMLACAVQTSITALRGRFARPRTSLP